MSRRQISDVRSLWCSQLFFSICFIKRLCARVLPYCVLSGLLAVYTLHVRSWLHDHDYILFIFAANCKCLCASLLFARGDSQTRERSGIINVCKNINDALNKDRWDKSGQLKD